MRVRIRRFGRLRLTRKSGYSDSVVVADIETGLHEHGRVAPPPASIRRDLRRCVLVYAEFAQFSVDSGAAFPLFELQRTQAVADPFVVVGEDLRRVRQLEAMRNASMPNGRVPPSSFGSSTRRTGGGK